MNKKFVYQIGNNKKVILWCTANQISRFTGFVWIPEQTASFSLYNKDKLVFITKTDSVYSAVRTESLYNTYIWSLKG